VNTVAEEQADRRQRRRGARRRTQCWMLVTSTENYRKTRERGFSVVGLRTPHRRRAESMRSGDRLLFYVSGCMAFAATCTVTSGMFEDRSPVWKSPRRDEDYPWRLRIRLDHVLDESDWVPARDLAYRMEYVRKWPPELWTLAFQGHVHQLPQKDFKLVESELRRIERARRAPA
jgi:hypothetical protein